MQAKYKVRVIDEKWLKGNIKCLIGCPVETNPAEYIAAIARGDMELAFRIAALPNPFIYSCGRICSHPCESACRRGDLDSPISIRALKRAATDYFRPSPTETSVRSLPQTRAKVAIIGAGPAGLSCAHDLALLGHPVKIFEATEHLGGMLRLGVPEYRLPRSILNMDLHRILDTGVEVEYGVRFGEDGNDLGRLRSEGYRAIFIAVGAGVSSQPNIPGTELDGVINGIEFLLNVNLGYRVELGRRVLVIGGGNVAFDVARTAVRAESNDEEASHDLQSALDIARSALAMGTREVHLMCLESLEEMPADLIEIEEGIEEGINLHTRRGPQSIQGNGRVTGVETVHCTQVFDSQGRFRPTFDYSDREHIEVDNVIIAIGQRPDLSFLREEDGIKLTQGGTVEVEPATLQTSAPDVFCGGDSAFGPRVAIDAVADGRLAARSIRSLLESDTDVPATWQIGPAEPQKRVCGYDTIARLKVPTIPTERRVGFAEVESGYSREAAVIEANRCLRCNLNPVIDAELCILCGGCVDVCPYSCILMVEPAECDLSDPRVIESIRNAYELALDADVEEMARRGELPGKLMLKDEELCTRCGLCVERCPTGAITMEAYRPMEVVALERQAQQ